MESGEGFGFALCGVEEGCAEHVHTLDVYARFGASWGGGCRGCGGGGGALGMFAYGRGVLEVRAAEGGCEIIENWWGGRRLFGIM